MTNGDSNPPVLTASYSMEYEEEKPVEKTGKKPVLLVEDLSSFTKNGEEFYRNYFHMEGGTFPDLFSREIAARNDKMSTVKYVSVPRGQRLFGDLLTAVLTEKIRSENADRTKNGARPLAEDLGAHRDLVAGIMKKFAGSMTLRDKVDPDSKEPDKGTRE